MSSGQPIDADGPRKLFVSITAAVARDRVDVGGGVGDFSGKDLVGITGVC